MITLNKKVNKEFVVLNLTDIHLSEDDWNTKSFCYKTCINTIRELVIRIKPDLITVSGDIVYPPTDNLSYKYFSDFIDEFKIKWAFIWGNHDQDSGKKCVMENEKILEHGKYSIYESGDKKLGIGNYIIKINENDRPVSALFMVDSHNRQVFFDGVNKIKGWASWSEKQKQWYRQNIVLLKDEGYKDSVIISHIPIYGYKQAYEEAFYNGQWQHVNNVSMAESYGGDCWKDGYKDSFGVKYEGFGTPKVDDGVLDLICELGHTKNYIAGHDHINNYSIIYKGVRLTYATKTGAGCYWDRGLNGGTVITIGEKGVKNIRHEIVDCSAIRR